MKRNPDDRRDNVKKIQQNINNTIENMELADEMMSATDSEEIKNQLKEKNKKRADALRGMRHEIKDEAVDKENGYKY